MKDNRENYDLLFKRHEETAGKRMKDKEEEDPDGLPSWVNNFQNAQKKNYIMNKKEYREKMVKELMKKAGVRKGTGAQKDSDDFLDELIDYESEGEEFGMTSTAKKVRKTEEENEEKRAENDYFKVKENSIVEIIIEDNICNKNTFPIETVHKGNTEDCVQ